MNYFTLIFPAVTAAALLVFFLYYRQVMADDSLGNVGWISEYGKKDMSFRRYPMGRKDILPLAIIVAVYGVVAFWNLGDNQAPQSFYQFNAVEPSVVLELDEKTDVSEVMYYTGLYTGDYMLFYNTGTGWTEATAGDGKHAIHQEHSDLFKWITADIPTLKDVTAIRITALNTPLELGEVVLRDSTGGIISYTTSAESLNDEQSIAPEFPYWMNSAYFDEIYHARSAYENLTNVYPYELSHPPLGKIIITVGIRLFGMTPFGWRFMGTLFGVLMLIPFYVLLKNMFGKTPVAVCGTVLFAFDFMHFVQTRIATIDTYGVIFIILSYLFMWRYVTVPEEEPFKKGLGQLMLSGLFFGIGCACKWTVVYAGVGLAVIYVIALVRRGMHCYNDMRMGDFAKFLIKTLLMSVVGFIIVPVTVYCLSYIPYGLAKDMTFPEMLTSSEYYSLIWNNQVFMLTYHQGVHQEHPYAARWWQWVLDIRPILYYLKYDGDFKSAFGCFNNPIVAWGGLLAVVTLPISLIKRKKGAALFIFIGYLSQLLPWVFIGRTTFEYHYFPSTVFLVLALTYVLNELYEKGKKVITYCFAGVTTAMFPLFYPVLTGVWVNTQWCQNVLKWLPTWPFG